MVMIPQAIFTELMKRRMSPWGASFGNGRSSDPAAMASGPPDAMANQEPAEVAEDCSGKKKSKFQTFKNFFARKKKKEPSGDHAELKGSQSSDSISKTSENNTLRRSEKERGSKISLGSKALSHDSVFVSDSSEANEALGASQDSIHGKVKFLQLQLKQAIRLGSPPSLMCVKRAEDAGTTSEDDGLPCSPPEYTSPHVAMNQTQRNSSISLEGVDSDEDQRAARWLAQHALVINPPPVFDMVLSRLSCAASSRAVSPLVTVPGDFSQPASPFGCLDNSAAKHKLGLRHKACNRRKPANRIEIKSEEHNGIDESLSIPFPECLEAQDEEKIRDPNGDEPKQQLEEEDECHENEQLFLQGAEGEESEAEEDLSLAHLCQSEMVAADTQPPPSPELSTRSSSLDSPGATLEPPAGHIDFLDHSLVKEKEENMDGPDLGEEDGLGDGVAGDFLQEVLSSLKKPLPSCSPCVDSEDLVLEIKEEKKETEDEQEVKNEPAFHQVAPCDALLLDQSSEEEEEEEELATLSNPSLHVDEKEESEDDDEKEEEEEVEEEELVVERFSQCCIQLEDTGEYDAPQEVKPEEQQHHWEEQETEASEEEQKGTDLEPEGEGQEVSVAEEVEEKQHWIEEAGEEEWDMLPDEICHEVCNVSILTEEKEHADAMKNAECTRDGETPQEPCDGVADSQVSPNENDRERQARESGAEDEDDIKHIEPHSEPQEEADLDKDENVVREEVLEMKEEIEAKQIISPFSSSSHAPSQDNEALALSTTTTLSGTNTPIETITPQETMVPCETVTPRETTIPTETLPPTETIPPAENNTPTETSNAATTAVHMNLVSPNSESRTFAFQLSPTDEDCKVSSSNSTTEQHAVEEAADTVTEIQEEQVTQICDTAAVVEEAMPSSPEDEVANQSLEGPDESKVCFTIAPTWQRSLSGGEDKETPSSSSAPTPSAGPGHGDVEATTKEDPQVDAQMENLVKTTVAGGTAAKPANTVVQEPFRAQTSAVAAKEGSSVVIEGNYHSPFGVRLRKTAVLHRFSSEEENTEAPIEPPVEPVSCKAEATSFKPSISQPVGTKPALPKKPDVHGDTGVKTKRVSEPAAAPGASAGSDGPSWISVARQKQKIYKENSLDEMTVKKEEQDRKSSVPTYVSSALKKELCTKTPEFTGRVVMDRLTDEVRLESPWTMMFADDIAICSESREQVEEQLERWRHALEKKEMKISQMSLSEISKPSSSTENETKKSLSPVTPVPPQPPKSQPLPCPVNPKPPLPLATSKPAPQAAPSHRSLSPPIPVPVTIKPPPTSNPSALSKTSAEFKPAQTQSLALTSPPFSSRINPPLPASRVPALSGPSTASQRSLPPPSLSQDEPPWMALAKKKAKAWSEMPQIVQ
ncbi:capping protein-inhibiting regulator of actin dynamics isoform X1 [Phyllopteryx taeniolatus]|uniref:capping protein-inhibiting regulator of actin dynamics isoform X1 n=1 Tax=Phyllopteryx taeniolatus TaxID=161469 RepID=UPI002AD220DB|nr:capping protein-inhibiting regulator of actin dynamics isoform X1 [Phyllopteryx taeniolatus]